MPLTLTPQHLDAAQKVRPGKDNEAVVPDPGQNPQPQHIVTMQAVGEIPKKYLAAPETVAG